MKDGAILANSGHFNAEVNLEALAEMAGEGRRTLRPFVEEFKFADDQSVIVLGEGRLINLAAAEGHPASVMDMSFANQALAAGYIVRERANLENRGLSRAGRDRSRDRAPQAGQHGYRDRHPDRRAGTLPQFLGRRNLIW